MVEDLVGLTETSIEIDFPGNIISVVTMSIGLGNVNSYLIVAMFVEIPDTEIRIVHSIGSRKLCADYAGTLGTKPVIVP